MQSNTDLSSLQRVIVNFLATGWPTTEIEPLREGLCGKAKKPRAFQASFSRAIRRLAKRGLVIPIAYHTTRKGERARALVLTPKGMELLKSPAVTQSLGAGKVPTAQHTPARATPPARG
jgi:hypothetical protein